MSIVPRYIGCLTNPYTPSKPPVHPFILDPDKGERNELSAKDRKNRKNDPASRVPPYNFSQRGNAGNHPNRFASSGMMKNQRMNPIGSPKTTYQSQHSWFSVPGCLNLFSSNAGSFCSRYRIVVKQRTINQILKIQPSGQLRSPDRPGRMTGNNRIWRNAKMIFFFLRNYQWPGIIMSALRDRVLTGVFYAPPVSSRPFSVRSSYPGEHPRSRVPRSRRPGHP